MKKFLSLALLLGSLVCLQAQHSVGFVVDGRTYQNGDTIVVTLDPEAENYSGLSFRNLSYSALQDMIVTLIPVDTSGIVAWGLCTGTVCIPGLTSSTFVLPPSGSYNEFVIDLTIKPVENPVGIYTVVAFNDIISDTVTLRFQTSTQGIGEVASTRLLSAYPNPAQGTVHIRYQLSQPGTLLLYDMQGRPVRQLPVSGHGTALFEDLPAGLYAYGIAGQPLQKLIVQ